MATWVPSFGQPAPTSNRERCTISLSTSMPLSSDASSALRRRCRFRSAYRCKSQSGAILATPEMGRRACRHSERPRQVSYPYIHRAYSLEHRRRGEAPWPDGIGEAELVAVARELLAVVVAIAGLQSGRGMGKRGQICQRALIVERSGRTRMPRRSTRVNVTISSRNTQSSEVESHPYPRLSQTNIVERRYASSLILNDYHSRGQPLEGTSTATFRYDVVKVPIC